MMGHLQDLVNRIYLESGILLNRHNQIRSKSGRQFCESTFARTLNTDFIDLYYLHRLDKKVPIEETVGAMSGLVEEGKVRYIGLCEVSAKTLHKANKVHQLISKLIMICGSSRIRQSVDICSKNFNRLSIPCFLETLPRVRWA